MNGLTIDEIESRKKSLYAKYYGDKMRVNENLKQPWSRKDKTEMKELDFRGWINSCLIYGNTNKLTAKELSTYNPCIFQTTLALYEMKLPRALELIEEQKERFKTAKVQIGVFTDSEGCTYNSCEWN